MLLHIQSEMSCQIAVVLWKKKLLEFLRGTEPRFQLEFYRAVIVLYVEQGLGLHYAEETTGTNKMDECSIFSMKL